jgi:D-alanyl-D-alanine carboxypeptidase (penicillin-binding protein 5/6)
MLSLYNSWAVLVYDVRKRMKKYGRSGGKRWLYGGVVLVLLLGGYTYWAARRALPSLQPTASPSQLQIKSPPPNLAWPTAGQAAVGVAGSSILATHGAQTPLPTASTAKLITALVVLNQKPLSAGQPGPTINLGPADVALYNSYRAGGGSVVPVAAGEQINEYQMLQTLMLPSANNMADSLAVWAFGSLPAYKAAADSYLNSHVLTHTRVGTEDASGFAPSTTSTAQDLVKIGELAMENPVLAQIVGQATADGLPMANTIKNVNFLLGTDNIIGVKTGNTDEAGGVFVSASRTTVNGKPATIVTALLGAPTLFAAMKNSLPLIQTAQANFKPVSIIKAGSIVGHYRLPWGGSIPAIAAKDLNVTVWNGSTASAVISLNPVAAHAQAGTITGSLRLPKSTLADQQSVPVKLQAAPSQPSLRWRLLHP